MSPWKEVLGGENLGREVCCDGRPLPAGPGRRGRRGRPERAGRRGRPRRGRPERASRRVRGHPERGLGEHAVASLGRGRSLAWRRSSCNRSALALARRDMARLRESLARAAVRQTSRSGSRLWLAARRSDRAVLSEQSRAASPVSGKGREFPARSKRWAAGGGASSLAVSGERSTWAG